MAGSNEFRLTGVAPGESADAALHEPIPPIASWQREQTVQTLMELMGWERERAEAVMDLPEIKP